ncbi:MAG TPA: MFS transporter [Longilinea sp.]|nr:MFS transporter [Longilinea sp.]
MNKPGFQIPPALRNRQFLVYWSGQLISIAGSQMQLWALYWHIRTLTSEPIALGGIGVVRFLPVLVFSLLGGLVADQFNRRTIVLITQTTLMLVAGVLGLLTWLGTIQIWHIYLLVGIQAFAISFDGPARAALVPNLVTREDLPNAFSMTSLAQNVGAIIGPLFSGVVIASLGQQWAYWINAISFLAVIISLLMIGAIPQSQIVHIGNNWLQWDTIKEGIRYILTQPIILSSMVLDFFATFFSSANTLLPFVARDILNVGAVQYGWLSAAQSVGSVAVALYISQNSRLRRQGVVLLSAVGMFGIGTILFGASTSFWLTMLSLIVIGGSDTISTILRNTIRQLITPDEMRGRMTSINQIFFMGGPQLGEIEAGIVAQAFSVPAAIISGGIGCILAVSFIAWRWPQLRQYDDTAH